MRKNYFPTSRVGQLANLTPFKPVWLGSELTNYREAESTYSSYPLDTLPPVPADILDGTFSWLLESPLPESSCGNSEAYSKKLKKALEELKSSASKIGLELPEEFIYLMSNSDLRARVISLTGSYWSIDRFFPCPISDGYLALFRSEGQECFFGIYI